MTPQDLYGWVEEARGRKTWCLRRRYRRILRTLAKERVPNTRADLWIEAGAILEVLKERGKRLPRLGVRERREISRQR